MNVSLCRDDATYTAGGFLKASWRVSRVAIEDVQGVEVSVLWHTEGKGDEDLAVHFFRRYDAMELHSIGVGESQPIECRLPASPLSYRGTLIKIQWGVRVRVFVANGPEAVAQHPFYMVARKPKPIVVESAIELPVNRLDQPEPRTIRNRLPSVIRQWRLKRSDWLGS